MYVGIDRLTQDRVAIKRLVKAPSTAREMAAYTMLQAFPHGNVLRMRACFLAEHHGVDCLYLVTDLLPTSLWDIFRSPLGRRGLVDMHRIAGYLKGIAAGLGHLHAHGVVHVDVSLMNVLVDASHCAKICDLGTAHSAQSLLGSMPITTGYVRAPEQWAGSPDAGSAADAWAVGVIALAMCTGECPFMPGETPRPKRPQRSCA